MICSHCKEWLPIGSTHCANCGEAVIAGPAGDSTGMMAGFILLGAVLGLGGTIGLYMLSVPFGSIGAPQHPQEFEASRGVGWFALSCDVALVALLMFMLYRTSQMRPSIRAFFITALVIALGGMSLCSLFSVPEIFTAPH